MLLERDANSEIFAKAYRCDTLKILKYYELYFI